MNKLAPQDIRAPTTDPCRGENIFEMEENSTVDKKATDVTRDDLLTDALVEANPTRLTVNKSCGIH